MKATKELTDLFVYMYICLYTYINIYTYIQRMGYLTTYKYK